MIDDPRKQYVDYIHKVLYGSSLDEIGFAEFERIGIFDKDFDVHSPASIAGVARRMIMMRQRSRYPTPFSVKLDPKDAHYHTTQGFVIAVDLADFAVGNSVAANNIYDAPLTDLFRRHVKPGMHVVDIGANIGYFTLLAASLVGPTGKVTAFEPNSENCRLMLMSIEHNNFQNVKLIPVALGREAGNALFATDLGSNGAFADPSSHRYYDIVPVMAIDDILKEPVDLIKIDVEGAEEFVFSGGMQMLKTSKPIIFSEFSPIMIPISSKIADAMAYLERLCSLGYKVFDIRQKGNVAEEVEIASLSSYMSSYGDGNMHHISNLSFYPGDRTPK